LSICLRKASSGSEKKEVQLDFLLAVSAAAATASVSMPVAVAAASARKNTLVVRRADAWSRKEGAASSRLALTSVVWQRPVCGCVVGRREGRRRR